MLSGKNAEIDNTGVPINADDDFSFGPGECLGINGLHLTLVITSFYRAAFGDNPDAQAAALSRQRVNRDAQLLMPPLRLMNASSGSGGDLYAKAYRRRRDHFDPCACRPLPARQCSE